MPIAMLIVKDENGYDSILRDAKNDKLFDEFINEKLSEDMNRTLRQFDNESDNEQLIVIVKNKDDYQYAFIPMDYVSFFMHDDNDKELTMLAAQAFLYTYGVANLTTNDITTEKDVVQWVEISGEDYKLSEDELEMKYGNIRVVREFDDVTGNSVKTIYRPQSYVITNVYPALGIKGKTFTKDEIGTLIDDRSLRDIEGRAAIIYTDLRTATEIANDKQLVEQMVYKQIFAGTPVTKVRGRIYEDKKVSIPTYKAIDKDIILDIEGVEPHMYIDKAAENEIAVYGVDVFTDKGEKIHIVNLTSHPITLKDSSGNNETVLDVLSTYNIVKDPEIGEDIENISYTINVHMKKLELPTEDENIKIVSIVPLLTLEQMDKIKEAIIMAREYAIRNQKGVDKIYAVVSFPDLVAITKHLQDYPNSELAELLNRKPQIEFVKGNVVRDENETYMLLDKWQQIKEIKILPSYGEIFSTEEKINAIEEKINERYQQIFKSVRHLKQVLRGIAWLGSYHVVLDIWRQYQNTGNKELDKIGETAEKVLKEFGYFRKGKDGMKEYVYAAPNQDIVLKFDELVDTLFLSNFDFIRKEVYDNWKEVDNILNDPDTVLYGFFDHRPLFKIGYSGDYAVYWTKRGNEDIWLLAEKDSKAENYLDAVVYSSSVNIFSYHEVITPETIPTEVKRRTGAYRKMNKDENNRGLFLR